MEEQNIVEYNEIKPQSYENAKLSLKAFSEKTGGALKLNKVDSFGGLFGWFDHKVTGDELNKLTGQIQKYLVKFNNLNKDFISQFDEVYNALESLDSEYIPAILSAVKGAETASDQALRAQNDIQKTIEIQKKIVDKLSEHKEKLDQLSHLYNIDELWEQVGENDSRINNLTEKTTELSEQDNKHNTNITEIFKELDDVGNTLKNERKEINDNINTKYNNLIEKNASLESVFKVKIQNLVDDSIKQQNHYKKATIIIIIISSFSGILAITELILSIIGVI